MDAAIQKKMNRRKAIGSILLFAGTGAAVWSGIRLRKLYSTPDLGTLQTQYALITALAETIIPATNTPGAKAAGITPFIIRMIEDCTSKREQNRFIMGLNELDDYTKAVFHLSFTNASTTEKNIVAAHFEKRDRPHKGIAGKISRRVLGDSFFTIMKKYTVIGYCTSLEGAIHGLAYDYVPGRYVGTIQLSPGQKGWATE
jgi:hypothetical protein